MVLRSLITLFGISSSGDRRTQTNRPLAVGNEDTRFRVSLPYAADRMPKRNNYFHNYCVSTLTRPPTTC